MLLANSCVEHATDQPEERRETYLVIRQRYVIPSVAKNLSGEGFKDLQHSLLEVLSGAEC